MTFYCLNIVDQYNNNMGSADIVDQMRKVHRYYSQWHINSKWWLAIYCWGYKLLLKILTGLMHRSNKKRNI